MFLLIILEIRGILKYSICSYKESVEDGGDGGNLLESPENTNILIDIPKEPHNSRLCFKRTKTPLVVSSWSLTEDSQAMTVNGLE